MYDIHVYDKTQLDDLEESVREQIVSEIKNAAEHRNPHSYRNTEKLNSNRDLFKLKVRNHRVIFGTVARYLIVFRVCYRGDGKVYRNIDHLEELWDQAQKEAQKTMA